MKVFGYAKGVFSGLIVLLWAAAAVAAPAITATPAAGPPTTKITVTGTGYAVSKLIDVYFDTTNLCVNATDVTGKFSCTFKVSSSAQPGTHWITAAERISGNAAQKTYTVRTNWPQLGNGPANSGYNRYENTITTYNAASLSMSWEKVLGDSIDTASPAVANNIVYIGCDDGKLYAFNATTGAKITGFPKTTGDITYGTPAVANNIVYIASQDHYLYAFNASTGANITGFPVSVANPVYGSPVVANGKVYVATYYNNVYAFNASTGAKITGFPVTLGGTITGSPAVANNIVYIGSDDMKLYAFNASTGAAITGFPVTTGGKISAAPAVAYGIVYVGAKDMNLYAFNASTGVAITGFPKTTSSTPFSSPVVANGVVYIIDAFYINAYNAFDGTVKAGFPVNAGWDNICAPALANGILYVGDDNGKLYAFSASSGALLWTFQTGDVIRSSPAVANGVVYVGSWDKGLYAFSLNGEKYSLKEAVRPDPAALVPDYTLKLQQQQEGEQ